jgi:perosamine synthetase
MIVPDNVYVAAWNSFLFDSQFGLKPVQSDLKTWNFDYEELDRVIRLVQDRGETAAVLVVPNLGNVINVPALQQKYPDVIFVEDNCEGFLGKYEGQFTGTASLASSISFFGNKTLTSGEGGAVIVQTEEMYEYIKCLHGQGQSAKKFVHQELGYNYRMTNIQAAILYGQLEVLPEILDRKQQIFETYRRALGGHDRVELQTQESGTEHANWMFGLRVVGNPGYEQTESFFKSREVEVRPMFYPMSAHSHMRIFTHPVLDYTYDEQVAVTLNRECVILPSYPELTVEEQQHVLKTLEEYIQTFTP